MRLDREPSTTDSGRDGEERNVSIEDGEFNGKTVGRISEAMFYPSGDISQFRGPFASCVLAYTSGSG